ASAGAAKLETPFERVIALRRMHRSVSGEDKLAPPFVTQPSQRYRANAGLVGKDRVSRVRFFDESAGVVRVVEKARPHRTKVSSADQGPAPRSGAPLAENARPSGHRASDVQGIWARSCRAEIRSERE